MFNNDNPFASYEYNLFPDEEEYYSGVVSSLSLDLSATSDKAIISVTNNGTIAAEFVQYTVLFFNGDEVVNYGWGYLTDDDSEIKPGRMEIREESCRDSFTHAAVYLSGRGDR